MPKQLKKYKLTIDTKLCNGCRMCEVSCAAYSKGVVNVEKANISILINEEGEVEAFQKEICLCSTDTTELPCIEFCPVDAISFTD